MTKKMSVYTVLLFFCAIIFTAAIYWQGLDGPFLLDDRQNVVGTYLNGFDWNKIVYFTTHNTSGDLGRPVSALSIVSSGLMHGPSAWGYKYHNLLIHLLNGLLVFWLLFRMIPNLDNKLSIERTTLISAVVASCWLLHPLMVSTVLYAVQRMAELSALFTLLALLTYVVSRQNIAKNQFQFFIGMYFFFPCFLILAVLSKENGALIPFYVFIIEMLVFKFAYNGRTEKRQMLAFLGIFVVIPIIVGSSFIILNLDSFTSYASRNFNVYERLMTEVHVVFFYIKLILLPQLSDMSLFHDDFFVTREFDLLTFVMLSLIGVAIFLVYFLRKKAPVISFGIAWFFVSHLMESTFIDLELVFEHRNYLALLGLILPIFYYLLSRPKNAYMSYASYVILAFVALLTTMRVQGWKSEEMIFLVALAEHPGSPRVHIEYTNITFNRGEFDKAIEHINIAQELEDDEAGSVIHEIFLRCISGEPVEHIFPEARMRLSKYPVTPYTLNAIENLIARRDVGACSDVKMESILDLVQVARNQEDNTKKIRFLGFIQRLEAKIHFINGDYLKGVDNMIMAYTSNPETEILFELANVQLVYQQVEDVKWTIAKIEEVNAASYGIEDSKLAELKNKLDNLISTTNPLMQE